MKIRVVVVVGCLLALSNISRAQYRNPYNNMTWNNVFSRNVDMFNSMNQNLMSQMNRINASRAALRKSLGAGETAPAPAAPAKVAHKPLSATDFKPADKGHPLIEKFVVGFQLAPADRDGLRVALEQTFKNFEKEARKNNVATSFGIAIAAAMHVANGYDIPDPQGDELVAGLNDAISASPAWKKMSARDKQTVSDGMLLYAAMMLQLAGQPDENIKQAGVTMAREFLKALTGSAQGG